jgi:hypothetical protein
MKLQPIQRVADALQIKRSAPSERLYTHEKRDIHDIDQILRDPELLTSTLKLVQGGASGQFNPRKYKVIPNMGTVWDYRRFTVPNGPHMRPLIFTQHIPVIRQMDGRADLDVLWKVLVAQGLMVQNGTDGEGNVAFYTNMDRICWHARGANSLGPGTEHMHLTTAESWSDRQLNAAAYLSNRLYENHGVSRKHGHIVPNTPGTVAVTRRGHVTHEAVSKKAGFNDRSDPGDKYEALMDEIKDRAVFFGRNHRF